jgi:putative addiction module component (TIGR02574 family)
VSAIIGTSVRLGRNAQQELDRRLEAYERNPDAGVPWAELKQRLLAR